MRRHISRVRLFVTILFGLLFSGLDLTGSRNSSGLAWPAVSTVSAQVVLPCIETGDGWVRTCDLPNLGGGHGTHGGGPGSGSSGISSSLGSAGVGNTNASNYAVGIGLNGYGLSRQGAIDYANSFASLFSRNAGSPAQAAWWGRGWDAAASGACGR